MDREYPIYPLALDRVLDAYDMQAGHSLPGVNLCSGASSFDITPFLDLNGLTRRLRETVPYGDPLGLASLRTRLAAIHSEEYGTEIHPQRICITDGATGALLTALVALVEPGDEVILPDVSFPPYTMLVHMLGGKCVFAPMDAEQNYDIAALPGLITPRTCAILVNSPGNPFGNTLSRAQLEAIDSLGVPVVSDEVYQFLASPRPTSVLELGVHHERNYVVHSFSKGFALAGYRLGYLVFPEDKVDLVKAIKATLNICTSLPSQLLGESLLERRGEIFQQHRDHLAHNRAFVRDWGARNEKRIVTSGDAIFFALLDVADILDGRSTLDLALELVQRYNLALAPGADFARKDPGFLRLNFSSLPADLAAGCERLTRFFAER